MKSPLAALLVAFVTLPGVAQPPPDVERLASDARRALQGQGDPEGLARARQRWPEQEKQIEIAIAHQDRAARTGGMEKDQALDTYVTKAEMTDTALDHYLAGRMLGITGDQGKLDEARTHFERAITIDPYFYWAHHGLATFFANREQHEAAAKKYQQVLDLNPEFANSRRGLALCYVRLNRPADAEAQVRRILEANPNEVETLMLLGSILSERGRHADAIAAYESAQRLRPDLPQIKPELARCYARADQADRALTLYDEAIRADAGDWRSCIGAAEILVRQGHNHRAADYLQQALDRLPVTVKAERSNLEERIQMLRVRPEHEKVDTNRKMPADWITQLKNAPEAEKRREAIQIVARFPWTDPIVPQTLLEALQDQDPTVRTLALRALGKEWPREEFQDLATIVRILLRDRNESVRAMAARVLSDGGHPIAVPAMVRALDDQSPRVMWELHRGLNLLTYAYIEVVDPPESPDAAERLRLAKAWRAWYADNRDRYRKFEEEPR